MRKLAILIIIIVATATVALSQEASKTAKPQSEAKKALEKLKASPPSEKNQAKQ